MTTSGARKALAFALASGMALPAPALAAEDPTDVQLARLGVTRPCPFPLTAIVTKLRSSLCTESYSVLNEQWEGGVYKMKCRTLKRKRSLLPYIVRNYLLFWTTDPVESTTPWAAIAKDGSQVTIGVMLMLDNRPVVQVDEDFFDPSGWAQNVWIRLGL